MFPWGNLLAAEKTTCISRQMLRLMISHFKSIGYEPIVGDSFTADTPLFIKYDVDEMIDIKPICELIGETETDVLGREYDTSEKTYKVLCRSGWMKPKYIYRHKTNKPLYEVSEGNMSVTVTEDHSLFDDKQQKIMPNKINSNIKLEYYSNKISQTKNNTSKKEILVMAKMLKNKTIDRIPKQILNGTFENIKLFVDSLGVMDYQNYSKTCQAGIIFLKNRINGTI